MGKNKLKIEYIYHSGFTVETEKYFIVFDYFKGDITIPDKPVLVFCSHSHPDHFNEDIFKWNLASEDITYILSDDINMASMERMRIMGPYEKINFMDFTVDTFGSTDQGVSFLLEIDGFNIFFAGDLNWWHWENDPPEENELMEKSFKYEIEKIKGHKVDVAFFPVDPRLGESYSLGGDYFIENLGPRHFFPMHFGDNFDAVENFINNSSSKDTIIHKVERRNQVFTVD